MEKRSQSEVVGEEVRNGGLIAGFLGIILSAEAIILPAFGIALAGEIYRRSAKVRSGK